MRAPNKPSILDGHWDLPPVVLHPFSRGVDESAILAGGGPESWEAARRSLLLAHYCEFRMLCFLGKDLMRWIKQCADFASRDAALRQAGVREQSFADLLVNQTPPNVGARFSAWGVLDYRPIISRSIGLNAVFPYPPAFKVVAEEFLEDVCAYADGLFHSYQSVKPFPRLDAERFSVALYTSDEYVHTLEDQQA
jgi:hypothetical protein